MGHSNNRSNNEEDIVSDSEFGEREDEYDYENDGAHRYFPSNNEHVWQRWSQVPYFFEQSPRNFIERTNGTHLRPQSQLPCPYTYMLRPPPIGIRIPIIHWPQYLRQRGIFMISLQNRIQYRGHRVPLYDSHAQNRQFSGGQPSRVGGYPRSPSSTPPQAAYFENAAIANDLYRLYATRSPSAVNVALGPTSRLMRRKPRRPRNRRCRMNRDDLGEITVENPQTVENNEEEEEEDENDVENVQPCEAYKDINYDNDSDDDDNNRSHSIALPNMNIVC